MRMANLNFETQHVTCYYVHVKWYCMLHGTTCYMVLHVKLYYTLHDWIFCIISEIYEFMNDVITV